MKERMLTKKGMVFVDTVMNHFEPCLKVTQSKLKEDGTYHQETIRLTLDEMLKLRDLMERAQADLQQLAEDNKKQSVSMGIPISSHLMWSEEDDERLAKAYDSGKAMDKIAKVLQRSERAIWYRLQHLGKIPAVPPQYLLQAKA